MAKNASMEVRQILFGADGVGMGIIGKDHLEQGAHELAAAFKSTLAARYRLVDGAVTDAYSGMTDEQVIAAMEQAEAARAAALAAACAAKPLVITKLAFMNLFEDAEHQTNGLFTYDRKLLKPDAGQVRAANRRVLEAGYGRKLRDNEPG